MVCRTYLHPQSTRTASQLGPCVWTSRRCTRSEHIRTGAALRTTARCGYSGPAHGERTLALIPIPLWNHKRNVLITPLVYVVIDTPSWTLRPQTGLVSCPHPPCYLPSHTSSSHLTFCIQGTAGALGVARAARTRRPPCPRRCEHPPGPQRALTPHDRRGRGRATGAVRPAHPLYIKSA